MNKSLKKALSLAFVLGWAGAALAADAPASGQGSGSLPPTSTACQAPANDACCDNGSCCIDRDCCNEGCGCHGIIAGAEWHILRPVVNDNRAVIVNTTGGGTSATVNQNFQYRFESDPSFWLGYRGECGLGATVTWFHLNNSADTINDSVTGGTAAKTLTAQLFVISSGNLFPGVTVPFTFNSDIKMDIWDFDVTQRVELCSFELIFGGGIRYMHMGQDYNATATVPALPNFRVPAGSIVNSASDSFDGGGPTLILDGVRRFGCSGFGLYANARGGVVFGSKRESTSLAVTPGFLANFVAGGNALTTTVSNNESTLGFGEIELGVGWGRRMGSVCPFARLGFEGREYWGIGNASNSTAGTNSSAVGAYGLALSAGIGW